MATPTLKYVEPVVDEADLENAPEPVEIYGLPSGGGPSTVAWADVTGKPATYPPVVGTTATTAKAGNYQPTAANISDATAVGRSVLTAADAAAARTAIGAGTSNLAVGTTATTAKAGNYTPTWAEVSGKPAVIAAGADAAAARTAIGAGTSSLAIGTSSTTAAAGNHTHALTALAASVSGLTGATLQAVLEDISTRLAALETP